jgi:putative membrane protein
LKIATYIGALIGMTLLLGLLVHADFSALARILESGTAIVWLIPYRAVFFGLYAAGWWTLLQPVDRERRASFRFLFWVTTIREAVDRFLPVASVGGSVIGIRLVRWRGITLAPLGASVIVEIVLTLIASYLFAALGLVLLVGTGAGAEFRRVGWAFVLSIPVPLVTFLLLRHGALFAGLEVLLRRLTGTRNSSYDAATLDHEVRASLGRTAPLALAGALQLIALISGAFEIWFALRVFGHPVGLSASVILESMTVALRHMAFVIPAGLGVQEAGLVLFGHVLGIDSELALAVSMAKRLREIAWGIPMLISWQWSEGRRIHRLSRRPA